MMHLTFALLVSSLACLILPSHAFPVVPEPPTIRRRVAYSVVAVDGGSAATSLPANAPKATTVIYTSDQTQTSTETVTSTAVVSVSEPAKTIQVSVTLDFTKTMLASSPSTTPSKEPAYVMVNAGGTTSLSTTIVSTTQISTASVTIDRTSLIAVPTSASTSSSTTTPTSTSDSVSSYLAIASTSTSVTSSSMTTSPTVYSVVLPPSTAAIGTGIPPVGAPLPFGLAPLSSSEFTTPVTQPTTTSSKTYDNGLWHTRYPYWNATSTTLSSTATAAIARGAHNMWNK